MKDGQEQKQACASVVSPLSHRALSPQGHADISESGRAELLVPKWIREPPLHRLPQEEARERSLRSGPALRGPLLFGGESLFEIARDEVLVVQRDFREGDA